MATLATLLESDSDDSSSGEEAETPRNSLDTHASAAEDAKAFTDGQKPHKQESDEEIAARKK